MKYINQLEYRHIPYITHTKAAEDPNRVKDVARSGCGPCSVCMCIDLLTDKELGVIAGTDEIAAIGHRFAHGGKFDSSRVLDDETIAYL